MLEHIYASFNSAAEALWATIAADSAFRIGHPAKPKTLPADCLRVFWLDYGSQTGQPSETRSLVQLDVFVPGDAVGTAVARARALDDGMGFNASAGYGRLGVAEIDSDPVWFLGTIRLVPLETGWLNVPDDVPGVVHLARTVELFTTPA